MRNFNLLEVNSSYQYQSFCLEIHMKTAMVEIFFYILKGPK